MFGLWSPVTAVLVRRHSYKLILVVGMLGLFALMLSDFRFSLTDASVPVAAKVDPSTRPLTAGSNMDGFGAWAPDGKQIAFMRDGRIWVIPVAGGAGKALTKGESAWDAGPVWRPDGQQLAFVRLSVNGDTGRIMTLDLTTGQETEVTREKEPIGYLAWGPGGEKVYYTTPTALVQVQVKVRQRQEVLRVDPTWEMLAGGLAVSQDGAKVIFGAGPRTERGAEYDLWQLSVGGEAKPKRLTQAGGIMPALDPRGEKLVYRNPRKSTGIYLMDLSTHVTRQVLTDEQQIMFFHPAIGPDGRALVVSRLVLEGAGENGGSPRFTSHLHLHTLP